MSWPSIIGESEVAAVLVALAGVIGVVFGSHKERASARLAQEEAEAKFRLAEKAADDEDDKELLKRWRQYSAKLTKDLMEQESKYEQRLRDLESKSDQKLRALEVKNDELNKHVIKLIRESQQLMLAEARAQGEAQLLAEKVSSLESRLALTESELATALKEIDELQDAWGSES